MEEENKKKEPVQIRLSTAILGCLVLILIAIIVFLMFQNNILRNSKEEKQDQLAEVDTNTTEKENKKVENLTNENILSETNTVEENENIRDKAIKELKKCLSDKTWVNNNLTIKKDKYGEKITKDITQKRKFSVLTTSTDMPVVVVLVECETPEYNSEVYLVRYVNNKVKAELYFNVEVADQYSIYTSDKHISCMHGHMGDWNYSIDEITDTDVKMIEKEEGSAKYDEDGNPIDEDYKEMEAAVKKYNLKEISTELNINNLEKYLK